MQADMVKVADVEQRAEYLRHSTGKRSWASVIVNSAQFLCSHCNRPFDATEQQTAHHFARQCVGMDGAVPAYEPGEPSPVRIVGAAL